MTPHAERVLRYMLTNPMDPTWARDITEHTSLPNGTLLPILTRMLKQGWLERYWEDDFVAESEGRPRRRYYRFTQDGLEGARIALACWTAEHGSQSPARLHPSPLRPRGTGVNGA
ncbi:PadR family transcriptional regulator [Streptomyces phaeochromogenes]|uniref:PadR family transcriptional regulator n=1 Tax=Streptomyces phaeochromogenes TaxID=1923 RepID=UPI00387042FF